MQEDKTVRTRLAHNSSRASLCFPFVAHLAMQRESATSIPADVREKHRA